MRKSISRLFGKNRTRKDRRSSDRFSFRPSSLPPGSEVGGNSLDSTVQDIDITTTTNTNRIPELHSSNSEDLTNEVAVRPEEKLSEVISQPKHNINSSVDDSSSLIENVGDKSDKRTEGSETYKQKVTDQKMETEPQPVLDLAEKSLPEELGKVTLTDEVESTEAAAESGDTKNESDVMMIPKTNESVARPYDLIPLLEQTKLPRGGVSIETKAVGRIQFGIPPETIKDSMRLGIPVPQVYIVPVERFCREMGPALGVNLAEFEFPAYFNFFVYKKRCTLVVDSDDAEDNIRRVFSETLLGPAQFMRKENPLAYETEDFDPSFPKDMIPDFQKEFKHFRIMPDGKELVIETLLDFCHFNSNPNGHQLGIPAAVSKDDDESYDSADEYDAIQKMDDGGAEKEECVLIDEKDVERREQRKSWTYYQTRFNGEVAVVWPPTATDIEKANRSVPRVEIFKMPGGTEYILHDVDANNIIIGKARFSGHVKVSEDLRVDGFGGGSLIDDLKPKIKMISGVEEESVAEIDDDNKYSSVTSSIPPAVPPPSFHPPSFGVTVLGNSHGFDASGSVSGYVLWINGRGVMIDPPPYSSATLEREGIRPRTIVGIILTHCHADHDAGAFQKVLTGSPVVVITTPTIYKSFIRKYAALSALSPALLKHSHRYKPAIIGQPLRFQGATFRFTYSLHTIPCVGFRVEWRGRSMVFTADHFNSPAAIDKLQEDGILSKGRADDLRNIPLQETDLLLHEAGAPPIHTPLEVLMQLPAHVKERLYVVHTAKLPEGCELKAAPTGTAGTIRLDEHIFSNNTSSKRFDSEHVLAVTNDLNEPLTGIHSEYNGVRSDVDKVKPSSSEAVATTNNGCLVNPESRAALSGPPQVALRPSSSTDAWYILNLMSAVPFISSLSYAATMELLETARVDTYRKDECVVLSSRRSHLLCVVWEGTCTERKGGTCSVDKDTKWIPATWFAGDWTGPQVLQPEELLSGESKTSSTHDIVAISNEGVKAITIEFSSLHSILQIGSSLYRKYLEKMTHSDEQFQDSSTGLDAIIPTNPKISGNDINESNVLELLNCNSALRKLSAVQKRHVESLAEGPVTFQPNERMWQAGAPVEKAYIIVSGSATFHVRRNALLKASAGQEGFDREGGSASDGNDFNYLDVMKVSKDLDQQTHSDDNSDISSVECDDNRPFTMDWLNMVSGEQNNTNTAIPESKEFDNSFHARSVCSDTSQDEDMHDHDSDLLHSLGADEGGRTRRASSIIKRRGSRARIANKVLGRLYNRRVFTSRLVFSRGHFLGDVSRMVAGVLSTEDQHELEGNNLDEEGPGYGFGGKVEDDIEKTNVAGKGINWTIHEREGDQLIVHSSTLTAGKDGCVAYVFPRSSLIPLLDSYPGLLLSLLGTQVVV